MFLSNQPKNKVQVINALSLAPDVNDWLAHAQNPRILHVFDKTCNLINERKEVLSIVMPQIGNGPFNLVIEDGILFSEHLNLESPISISPTQLYLGDLTINPSDTKLWYPCPDWGKMYSRREELFVQLASLPISKYLKLGGFDRHLDDHSGLLNHQHLPITPISNSLVSSLASANLLSSLTAAQHLAGLGIGLTPAGDDFIMGAILATWIVHPFEVARVLAKEITDTAASLTTSLSAAWLRSAGRWEAGQVWHDLFDALLSADKMAVEKSIEKILAVGHTSGADALAGFFGVFNSYAESI